MLIYSVIISGSPFWNFVPKKCRKIRKKFFQNSCGIKISNWFRKDTKVGIDVPINNTYININRVAEAKGLKSNRSLRLEINKQESKYIAREVKVNGGTPYEILYSSLEPEIQEKLRENNTKSTTLVPLNYQPTTFVSESARLTSLARLDIVHQKITQTYYHNINTQLFRNTEQFWMTKK